MDKFYGSTRRREFLTHLAARGLYRSEPDAVRSHDPVSRRWTLPAPEGRGAAQRAEGPQGAAAAPRAVEAALTGAR